jgi:hypothetical protein
MPQAICSILGLTQAHGIERDIGVALKAPLQIPIRLAMTQKDKAVPGLHASPPCRAAAPSAHT